MNSNLSIFTQVALTLTLFTSATVSVDAKEATEYNAEAGNPSIPTVEEAEYNADIYLDTLDADGHLSILEAESYTAKSQEQKVTTEPKVAEAKEKKATTEAKTTEAKYIETKYSNSEATDTHKADHGSESNVKVAAAPKADSHGEAHGKSDSHGGAHGKSKDNSFLTKHTTEIEFTFAILVIVVGLIASERFQRVQEHQVGTTNEPNSKDFGFEES